MTFGTGPKRPEEFPIRVFDGQVVDAGVTPLHHAGFIKFPVLVAISAKPVPAVVMTFVRKPHRDPVVCERPEFLDETVVVFFRPFPGEEGDDVSPADNELRPVSPMTVFGIAQTNMLRIATVPIIFGQPDFGDGGFTCERRD